MSKAMVKKFTTTINKVNRLSLTDRFSKAYRSSMSEFQLMVHRVECKKAQ